MRLARVRSQGSAAAFATAIVQRAAAGYDGGLRQPLSFPNPACRARPATLALLAASALLCSCSSIPEWSADSSPPPLPATQPFDKAAGGNQVLSVNVRMADGEVLPFLVDTGAPFTTLDKSLEPKLGKRLGAEGEDYSWYGKVSASVYEAPQLYLGDTPLRLERRVLTDDLRKLASLGQPVMGILGLDCLRHYCIQLDFDAGTIQFLEPAQLDPGSLGTAYPISFSEDAATISGGILDLGKTRLKIDTGCTCDAVLAPRLAQAALREQQSEPDIEAASKTAAGRPVRQYIFQQAVFDGQLYRNFYLNESRVDNLLGLRFMARHLVTLDFPGRTLYLRRRDPLAGSDALPLGPANFFGDLMEARDFFASLKEQDRLPGIAKNDHGSVSASVDLSDKARLGTYPLSWTFYATKEGDPSIYHYTLVRPSSQAPWQLGQAWRTDSHGRLLEQYPVR